MDQLPAGAVDWSGGLNTKVAVATCPAGKTVFDAEQNAEYIAAYASDCGAMTAGQEAVEALPVSTDVCTTLVAMVVMLALACMVAEDRRIFHEEVMAGCRLAAARLLLAACDTVRHWPAAGGRRPAGYWPVLFCVWC